MSAAEPLIVLEGVTRVFGSGAAAFQALRGIDLTIESGDFVAIMGPSGSGKSSLMNILGCLDTPSGGSYRFRGLAVEGLSRDQRALLRRHALGFIFQGFNLLARTSAQENVELPLLYRGEPAAARHAAARAALAAVGLTGWEHHGPAELSGGQQQRVPIADALMPRAWPRTGRTKLCTSQLAESSQLTSIRRRSGTERSKSHAARRGRCGAVGAASVNAPSFGTWRAIASAASGSTPSTPNAALKPMPSISTPARIDPVMLAIAGARPSQLKTLMRSVAVPARRPALRWIVIMPMLAPVPQSTAATHSAA